MKVLTVQDPKNDLTAIQHAVVSRLKASSTPHLTIYTQALPFHIQFKRIYPFFHSWAVEPARFS
jgi:hypothetical protein